MPFTVSPVSPPGNLLMQAVNSSDTNPIPIGVATAGKRVYIAGMILAGGTTLIFRSNATEIFRLTTSGVAVRMFENWALNGRVYPMVSSNEGEVINLVPGASGMTGVVYYWIA